MTIEDILKALEKSGYEISTESRLARVGLKDRQEIAPIIEKYSWLYEPATFNFAKEKWDTEEDLKNKKALKLLYFSLVNGFLYRQIAELSDKIATELARTEVDIDGEKVSYHNLRPLLVKTPDFDKRERIQDAILRVIETINPDALFMLRKELDSIRNDLGFKNYIDLYATRKDMDYESFSRLVLQGKDGLNDLYLRTMRDFTEKVVDRPWTNMRSCHAGYATHLNDLDGFFPKEKLFPAFERTIEDLGLDLKSINIDIEDRPKKNPRAVCYGAKIPGEIHLIIKPTGGYYDFRAFFHESGHAENFANISPDLPFAFRHLSSSHALTELFSYLFESMTRDPLWLRKYVGLSSEEAKLAEYGSEIEDLFMLIRYFAKFIYEYKFFSAEEMDTSGKLYANTLTSFTNFIYSPVAYLDDMDSGFYSADYLRAWMGRAQLVGYLKKNNGEEWFSDKRTGEFLRTIWKDGFEFDLETQIEKQGIGRPFDIGPLVSGFKQIFS